MPTIVEGGPEYNKLMFDERSWTDDLPICKVSGMLKIMSFCKLSKKLLEMFRWFPLNNNLNIFVLDK